MIRHRFLALLGLAAMIPLTWGVVQGDFGLDTAAVRAVVLLAVLTVVDRFVMPVVRLLLGVPEPAELRRRQADEP